MAITLNASLTAGLVQTADTSGNISLQSGGSTVLAVTSTGTSITGTLSSTGVSTFPAGSASLPSITTTGDTNNGIYFPAADTIGFTTSGAEAMRIDSSGNVGIGTTSPTSSNGNVGRILQTAATGNTSATTISSTAGTGIDNAGIFEARATAQVSGSDRLGQIYFGRENTSTSSLSSYAAFSTSGSGTFTERMRIDSSGNVNIGQTSAFGAAIRTTIKAADASSQSLALVSAVTSGTGTMQYLVDGSNDVCGYIGINATANTTSYNTSSDYRLKENIVPMMGALDKVSQLKPVLWNWKHAPNIIGQGFIAHELAEVMPDCVSGEKDAVDEEGKPVYQGIDTSFLVATLTKAIQELSAKLDAQQQEINALKGVA